MVDCECVCGGSTTTQVLKLISGWSRSCGCFQKNRMTELKTTHGERHSPLYPIWVQMNQRCKNPRNRGFKNYGGRGISVCERWRKSFSDFVSDMGPRPEGLTIERKNNDGNYEPLNCKWATHKEQSNNQRKRMTKKQKKWEETAKICEQLSRGNSIEANQIRATNRRVEKRKGKTR